MSESLRNDGRIWVPARADDNRPPDQIPPAERDYFLERIYPAFGNLVPRDVASRAVKRIVDEGRGVGPIKNGVYLDFHDAIEREGRTVIEERYDNLFEMYQRITDDDPYHVPMRIYPAPHYTMGGLWVDYNLMTTIPGLYAIGEANFSDHGANRLGASALMQGLADGYFVLPITIGDYLAGFLGQAPVPSDDPVFDEARAGVTERVERFLAARGSRTVDWFHKELGKIMLEYCGMSRSAPGLEKALSEIPALYEEFRTDLRILGTAGGLNQTLERAGRVEDFFELGQAMCVDALEREESCGGHFREEFQSEEGEALRRDEDFSHVSVWEWTGDAGQPALNLEHLSFETVKPSTRSYK
jgi:succinate dehydrogenase / fumarate reductase flavoprotein subunit